MSREDFQQIRYKCLTVGRHLSLLPTSKGVFKRRETWKLITLASEFIAHPIRSRILSPPFRTMLQVLRLGEAGLVSLMPQISCLRWKVILLSQHRAGRPKCSKAMPFSLTNA